MRSLNFFQGMPLVSAARRASLRNLRRLVPHHRRPIDNAEHAIAEHSRLILFGFCIDATAQAQPSNTAIVVAAKCIRAMARLCSTSRQACTAGSDLA
ncbi:hypothetical protein ACTGJ9_017855 [Bradyrhizobium sp. RDM12]